ncbi:alcohol oxidase [Dendrothele bispora CBS 962.96]|uniref:Alcohol oxidase n=1 Tax=Dendrothele bispora (strain CBS 962.96) TaxID=1314807 RepID=A0A4S8LSG3_DENBC|nr:alcohol oxidase [Dendrothele bispora CBS 962.96]
MWPFYRSCPEISFSSVESEYDFIVVGGGTAGAVVANRLSAHGGAKVLLVERGPVADSWASRVPLLSSDFASDGSRTRKVLSVPQNSIGRSVELFTGSVLGGTSRINQMIYTRDVPAEYDAWRDAGNPGWGWDDMKPYFLKSEQALYDCDARVHGTKGTMIEWSNQTSTCFEFPGFSYVTEASHKLGLPWIEDLNSSDHPIIGCGALHFTRDQNQHRSSTYHAFLPFDLVVKRSSVLHILTNTEVAKLDVELTSMDVNDRSRVKGVVIKVRNSNEKKTIRIRRDVVLCAGPFGSPQILMLSGIGPASHLQEKGVPVIKNLPAVGSNLQDHFGVSVGFSVPMSHSLPSLEKRPWLFIIELIKYLFFGTGMLLAPVVQLVLFASSSMLDDDGRPKEITETKMETRLPDIEIMPMAYDSPEHPEKSRGMFSFLNVLLHPKSRGTVRLNSSDPSDSLIIDPKYLSNPNDYAPLRSSLKLTLRIREKMVEQGYPLGDFGSGVPEGEDDASLDKFISGKRNRTTYHYSSTCRMGPDNGKEDGGVVNEELLVHGFANLRVADSSIFPWILGTHLQAPTVAVAEKCADMILSKLFQERST